MSILKKNLPFLLIVFGVCGFAVKSIFIKISFEQGLSPAQLMGLRMLFSIPFFIAAWIFDSFLSKDKASSFNLKGIVLCACLYFFSSQADISGLKIVSVGMERTLLFTIPLFVLLLSTIILKKKYHYGIYFAAVFSWIGVIIAFFSEQSTQAGISTFKQIEGVGLVLLSAILYAAYYIYSAEDIKRTGFISFNSQVMILSSIFALISLVANGEIKETFDLQYKHLEMPFYLAVVSTVLPSFFMLYGVKICGATFVSFCNNASPFFTMLVGYIAINERFTLQGVIGLVFVMASIFYAQKYKEKK